MKPSNTPVSYVMCEHCRRFASKRFTRTPQGKQFSRLPDGWEICGGIIVCKECVQKSLAG